MHSPHARRPCGRLTMMRRRVLEAMAGKRAIVTGGSKGVGAVIARTLAEAGLHLAIVGRDDPGLRRTPGEVEAAGSECLVICADLATVEGARHAGAEALAAAEHWDVLVNNAGAVH